MCPFSTSERQNGSKPSVFDTFDFEIASRCNSVHFSTFERQKLSAVYTFDLETCFAPQRRALFQHLNFQQWSEHEVFLTFSLGNVFRATTACTFTSQFPKVVRACGVFNIVTWKCASRHNGVQFFISHLTTWLRTRRFSEPTFGPSGATNHWKKTQWAATFLLFRAPASSSFSLSLLSDLSSFLLLSDSFHLCFSNCPYCRKFHF